MKKSLSKYWRYKEKLIKDQARYLSYTGLTIQQVRKVRALIEEGLDSWQVEEATGVDYARVIEIKYGKLFRRV